MLVYIYYVIMATRSAEVDPSDVVPEGLAVDGGNLKLEGGGLAGTVAVRVGSCAPGGS